jgi:hypothetical protein
LVVDMPSGYHRQSAVEVLLDVKVGTLQATKVGGSRKIAAPILKLRNRWGKWPVLRLGRGKRPSAYIEVGGWFGFGEEVTLLPL